MKELEGILGVLDNAYSDLSDASTFVEDDDDYTPTEGALKNLERAVWLLNEVVTKQQGG